MEHFAGGSVAQRLRGGATVPRPDRAALAARGGPSALDAAHAAGVVHRDVKPGNLLLDAEDRLAVADFGIARVAAESALTQTGMIVGTAAYLSPEQRAGRAATPASDRYALAMVARELLPGAPPAALARGLAEDPDRRPGDRVRARGRDRARARRRTAPTAPRAPRAAGRRRTERHPRPCRGSPPPPRWPSWRPSWRSRCSRAATIRRPPGSPRHRGRSTAERPAATTATRPEQPATPTTTTQAASGESPSRAQRPRLRDAARRPCRRVPLLRRAVEGFRAQGATGDINYAYALYNLGNALRLAGDPAAAIPFLEERLRISSFKRGVVRKELELARAQAGTGTRTDDDEMLVTLTPS